MQRHLWQDGLPGTHFLRDGNLLTSFRWKIKLEASALPYSNFQRASAKFGHVVINNRNIKSYPFPTVLRILLDYGKELGMPDGVLIMDSVLTSTKSFSITLSDETDVSSHVTFPLWENTRKLEAHNAAALDKKPGVCRDCQGIGPVLSDMYGGT
ncbi:hypothetical protein F2Q69_00015515 [Brassica cretica]|uniref:Uncharacterized protein n=1 Tax=Brassica cretica TaxID=69181 RepID=A0A8S9R7K4_BRACR|nr:hypothetical protein F2Q69_00015515 [Brassica cretica]